MDVACSSLRRRLDHRSHCPPALAPSNNQSREPTSPLLMPQSGLSSIQIHPVATVRRDARAFPVAPAAPVLNFLRRRFRARATPHPVFFSSWFLARLPALTRRDVSRRPHATQTHWPACFVLRCRNRSSIGSLESKPMGQSG